jgi:hypothetical protein
MAAIEGNMDKLSTLAALAFALFVGAAAVIFPPLLRAQSASVTGATMTWYGVYTAANVTSVTSTKGEDTGVTPPATNSDQVTLPTTGSTLFGYGYTLSGGPPTALVAMTYRTIFPDGSHQDNIYDRLAINRQDLFIGESITSGSPTGTYNLQLWHNSVMLLQKSFTVSPQ